MQRKNNNEMKSAFYLSESELENGSHSHAIGMYEKENNEKTRENDKND